MANGSKDKIDNLTELFFGNPSKYEHIRVDRQFYDTFKSKVVQQDKVRRELEKRTGEQLFRSWKELSKALAEKQMRNRIL